MNGVSSAPIQSRTFMVSGAAAVLATIVAGSSLVQ